LLTSQSTNLFRSDDSATRCCVSHAQASLAPIDPSVRRDGPWPKPWERHHQWIPLGRRGERN
jgi:hypothetical protein